MLRLIPTQWTDRSANDQHAYTRLEVRGCPLLGMEIYYSIGKPLPLQNIATYITTVFVAIGTHICILY